MQVNKYGTIYGDSDDTGGCQWAVFPNECAGAKVVLTGGFDYGSWVQFMADISEKDYKFLQLWDSYTYNEQHALIDYFLSSY